MAIHQESCGILLIINLVYERGIFCHLQWVRFVVYCYDFLNSAMMRTSATSCRFAQFFSNYFYQFLPWDWMLDSMIFFTYILYKKIQLFSLSNFNQFLWLQVPFSARPYKRLSNRHLKSFLSLAWQFAFMTYWHLPVCCNH